MLGLAFAILNTWTALAASITLALPSGGSSSVISTHMGPSRRRHLQSMPVCLPGRVPGRLPIPFGGHHLMEEVQPCHQLHHGLDQCLRMGCSQRNGPPAGQHLRHQHQSFPSGVYYAAVAPAPHLHCVCAHRTRNQRLSHPVAAVHESGLLLVRRGVCHHCRHSVGVCFAQLPDGQVCVRAAYQ